ncbi:RagB/SusD family nutrient uptake outer membrane protein [Hymenobacter armeniacus]|uniref:RagB/SusD family nutrient uptake outer membrane protein n=1 Tax=Hymenobacter armeniacus TaxID=2771358 RepID=A0ABR8JUC7_9BACT|nr:RagB/SusD family nutrient uptake outer membrane protein [Hymenobacter armeniacus]MBD2722705.1 RagB/SusD family nutrient uptake outer membrane protein [Hymenobacter armeniacus]
MKNNSFSRGLITLALGTALAGLATSCQKDLDQTPKYEPTPDKVYVNLAAYKSVLGKLYGGFALTSLGGANGDSDIKGIDGGTGNYLRQLWSAQELTTDEAVVAWNDPGIQDWHNMNWDANNPLLRGLYNRAYYEISLCNELIRESSDDKLTSRLPSGDVAEAKRYRAEARFLRAVSYMHVIDLFGGGPFVTEANEVGVAAPPYNTRQQLYAFVESELLALKSELAPARGNEFGRVDQAAASGMLARLYLNAEVYSGTPQYAKAATEAQAVINSGYSLVTQASSASSAYGRNFLADNNLAPASNEIIWSILLDATRTTTYGGTTFLVNGSTNGASAGWQRYVGQTTGWGGMRATRALFDKFFLLGADTTVDRRGRFWTRGQTLEINDQSQFTQGVGVTKYRNINSDGSLIVGSQNFSSVDFPMLRLSDMMLIYAEAAARGAAARATGLEYVNKVRRRAFGLNINAPSAAADITDAQMTTDFILDERARELHWEAQRRTDLVRHGKFTSASYLWPWKGGVAAGRAVGDFRNLFPLPTSDLTANPNLKQNTGY